MPICTGTRATWETRYWYRRADQPLPEVSLEEEWAAIATQLLSRA
jgi:hypothetical protein